MGKTFIITPQAQRDFDSAYWWYEEQHGGLGKEFARCVDAKIAEVRRNPEQYGVIYKEVVRRALVTRFPYAVFYVDKPEVLSIFAVQRQSRNPNLWKSRV